MGDSLGGGPWVCQISGQLSDNGIQRLRITINDSGQGGLDLALKVRSISASDLDRSGRIPRQDIGIDCPPVFRTKTSGEGVIEDLHSLASDRDHQGERPRLKIFFYPDPQGAKLEADVKPFIAVFARLVRLVAAFDP